MVPVQKFGADLCRSRIIGAGRYRRPEICAGQIYLVPHRGLWSNVCTHWCPFVPNGIEKVANRKNCCIYLILCDKHSKIKISFLFLFLVFFFVFIANRFFFERTNSSLTLREFIQNCFKKFIENFKFYFKISNFRSRKFDKKSFTIEK